MAALAVPPWVVAQDRTILAQAGKPPATGAPSSRDELFGTKPPAGAPAAEEKAYSFSGFYDFLGAYTYSEPSHWSRAVNRLQLSAQGELGASVKWKIGGRFDIDPVYYWSDFYLQDVKENQRTSVFWRETYIDFSAGELEFRLGAQNIVWGEVVGIFVADVVTAKDQREFLLPPPSTSSASRSGPRAPSTSRAIRTSSSYGSLSRPSTTSASPAPISTRSGCPRRPPTAWPRRS
jgi:hypothetical protein